MEGDVIQRLARLEAANRQLRVAVVALGVVAVLGRLGPVGQAEAQDKGKTVEAQSFVLKDASGKKRGSFGLQEGGGVGLVVSVGEDARVGLGVNKDGLPSLVLGKAGVQRLAAMLGPNGPGFVLVGEDRKPRIVIGSERDAAGEDQQRITVHAADGLPRVGVVASSGGTGSLSLRLKEGDEGRVDGY